MKNDMKKKNNEKKQISAELSGFMMENSIERVNINKTDTLVHKQLRGKKAISKRFLTTQFNHIFSDDPTKASQMLDIILNNREEFTKNIIECKTSKN